MTAMSLSQVCGFIATIRSTPPRAPRWPASVTRTSYQVGRPWMLDGKMLRGATGTPMRSTARANNSLALAEPEPLTLAKRTTKSFTRLIGGLAVGMRSLRGSFRENFFMSQAPVGQRSAHSPQCRQTSSSFTMTRPVLSPSWT